MITCARQPPRKDEAVTTPETRRPRSFEEQTKVGPYEKDEVRRLQNHAHKTGYEDAVNNTVGLAGTPTGKRALDAAMKGDPKPYRKTMDRRRKDPFGQL
jgi:hypothetical protein